MAYTLQNWQTGDTITKEKLNAMDDQIALNERTTEGKLDKPATDGTTGQVLVLKDDGTLEYADKPVNGEQGPRGAAILEATKDVQSNEKLTIAELKIPDGITPAVGDLVIDTNGDTYFVMVKDDDGVTVGSALTVNVKGEPGTAGKNAPTITALTINVNGTAISGQATMSEGSPVAITGTYSAS